MKYNDWRDEATSVKWWGSFIFEVIIKGTFQAFLLLLILIEIFKYLF